MNRRERKNCRWVVEWLLTDQGCDIQELRRRVDSHEMSVSDGIKIQIHKMAEEVQSER